MESMAPGSDSSDGQDVGVQLDTPGRTPEETTPGIPVETPGIAPSDPEPTEPDPTPTPDPPTVSEPLVPPPLDPDEPTVRDLPPATSLSSQDPATDHAVLEQFDAYLQNRYAKGTYNNCRTVLKRFNEYLLDVSDAPGVPAPITPTTARGFLDTDWYKGSAPGMQRQSNVLMRELVAMKGGDFVPPSPRARAKPKTDPRAEGQDAQVQTPEPQPLATPKENNMSGIPVAADPVVVDVGGTVSSKADPKVGDLRKATGLQDRRLIIYAVDELGNQHEATRVSEAEMKYAGGAPAYIKQFLANLYPNAPEFRVAVADAKGTEKLQARIQMPRAATPSSPVEEVRKSLDAERRAARSEEMQRQEMEDKRFERMLGALNAVLPKEGSGGAGSLPREMIAMQMAREIMRDSSSRGDGYETALMRKLDEIAKAKDQRVAQGGREPSPMEQLMYVRATKQMMDEMFPPQPPQWGNQPPFGGPPMLPQPGGFSGFPGSSPGFDGLPPLPPLPPAHSPADDLEKITNTLARFMPQPQNMGPTEVIGLMRQFGEMTGGGGQNMMVQMLQNELQQARMEIAQIRNQPQPTFTDQVMGFAQAMQAMQQVMGGNSRGSMDTLEFVDSIADKVPKIIDSVVNARREARSEEHEYGGGESDVLDEDDASYYDEDDDSEDDLDDEFEERPKPKKKPTSKRKAQARTFQRFDHELRKATTRMDYGNALTNFVTGLKDDPKWAKLFKTIAVFAVRGEKKKVYALIKQILDAMYENQPPEGSVKNLTIVLLENSEMLAQYVGVDPSKARGEKKPKPVEPNFAADSPGTKAAAPAAPATKPASAQNPRPHPKLQVVDDDYPEPMDEPPVEDVTEPSEPGEPGKPSEPDDALQGEVLNVPPDALDDEEYGPMDDGRDNVQPGL